MNNAIFAGALGADARKNTVGENTVANFPVAVNQRRKGEDVTLWIDCAIWGKRADALAQYLTKGSKVTVSGAVSVDSYEKNGETIPKLKLFVNEITLQGGKQEQAPAQQKEEPAGGGDDFDDDVPF